MNLNTREGVLYGCGLVVKTVFTEMIAEIAAETIEEEKEGVKEDWGDFLIENADLLFDLTADQADDAHSVTTVTGVEERTVNPPVPSAATIDRPTASVTADPADDIHSVTTVTEVEQVTINRPPVLATIDASSVGISRQNLQEAIEEVNMEELVDDRVYRNYIKAQRNLNTSKKTESVMRKVHGYLKKAHNEERDVLSLPPGTLNSLMCSFILNIKKELPRGVTEDNAAPEQIYHQPETLTSYHSGVARYLRDNGYPYCMMSSPRFSLLKDVIKSRKAELKKMGLGNHPNAAIPLSDEDCETCWRTGAFGATSPRALQATLYFYFSNCFGWWARDEPTMCEWRDLKVVENGDNTYIEWNERTSKTRKGNNAPRKFPPRCYQVPDEDRCCVRLFAIYTSKRPECMKRPNSPLFLTPIHWATMDMEIGYSSDSDSGMSYDSIGKIMIRVKEAAGLLGQIKGHSTRKTCCNKLLRKGVAPVLICQLTGHKNESSINYYGTASEEQQHAMSDILMGNEAAPSEPPRKTPRASAAASSAAQLSDSNEDEVALPVVPVAPPPQEHRIPSDVARSCNQLAVQHTSTLAQCGPVSQHPDLAGILSGATIQGNVNINIHYGNIAASSTQSHSVHLSQEAPKSPILPLEPNFDTD